MGAIPLIFRHLSYPAIKGNMGKLPPQMTVLEDELKFVITDQGQWHHSCHSNEMMPILFLLLFNSHPYLSAHWNFILFPKSIMEAFSSNSFPSVREV